MANRTLDPVLARQLKRLSLPIEVENTPEWQRFLDAVNEHYLHMSEDRALLSRSIELSTGEMEGLRRRLEAQRDSLLSVLGGIGESLGQFADSLGARREADGDLAARARLELARRLQSLLDQTKLNEERGTEVASIRDNLLRVADQLVARGHGSVRKELEVARAVQQLLIPPQAVIEHPPLRFAGHFAPAEECGGDWWTVAQLPGRRSLVVVGDVTGHGVSSAIITGAAKAACELALHLAADTLTPAALLSMMNATLYRMACRNIMMTSVAAVFDPSARTLVVANAGHPFPLLVRDSITHPIMAEGPQLGDSPRATFENSTVELRHGDVMVCFTDGVTECENDRGERFGERRLRAIVQRVAAQGAKGVCDALVDALATFRAGHPQNDDLTMVVATLE